MRLPARASPTAHAPSCLRCGCAQDGVFHVRTCKLCKDEGVVVAGEYGITTALLRRGYNVDTLMAKYRGVS